MNDDTSKHYTTGQVAEQLNLPPSTILSFCRSGLVPGVRRDRRCRRIFQAWQLDHIRTLLGLRQAGFSNTELKHYARLVRQGQKTLPERKALMETRKRQLWQQLEDLQRGIDFLERQVEYIDQLQK